ncbi:MAG: suppressor of fused domain protein [Planctomycetota bacterium]|nr:suppressor of fused domain protein [Planctomycetota bacterium]
MLLADGSCVTPLAGCREGLCVMQYPPRPDRMSWVYVTHGLSQAARKGRRSSRLELVVHWRNRESQAARVLLHAARSMLESGSPVGPGTVISSRDVPGVAAPGLQHWLVCGPDRTIPERIEHPGGHVRFVLLLGITDAELQCALRVNSALADGRQVLLEAVRDGGVYPVSDPERNCLTRRGDFLRLWENAFRTVRERTANGTAV